MANTYTQIHIQIVFRVSGNNLISEEYRERIEKYICGIITKKKSKPLAIYCNPDHLHVLIGLHPSISVSEITRGIKANSTRYINENGLINGGFSWQTGFGAFSYSNSEIDRVIKYILKQPEHHRKTTFKEEYLQFLKDSKIDFNLSYVFD
ncbi:transposase [Chitinophagales bacterium]|nr:transposase [Chitinophagales bacterium]